MDGFLNFQRQKAQPRELLRGPQSFLVPSSSVCKQSCRWKTRLDFRVDMTAADIVLSGQLKPMKTHGTKVTKKATDLFDYSFADNLEKTGFLRELWGG
jgi:hypothetical protein